MPLFDWIFGKDDPLDKIYHIVISFDPEDDGAIEEIKKYISLLIKSGRSVDEIIGNHSSTALSCAISFRKYTIVRLLLEAGANPHLNCLNSNTNPFHDCISEYCLPQVRFFLFFNPQYRNLPPFGEALENYESVDQFLEKWDIRKKTDSFSIISIFEQTIDRSRKVIQLEEEVDAHLDAGRILKAISCCRQIADIFNEEFELEKNLTLQQYCRYPGDLSQKRDSFRKISTSYYQNKARNYYVEAEQLCRSIENPDKEFMKLHLSLATQVLRYNAIIRKNNSSFALAEHTIEVANIVAKLSISLNPLSSEVHQKYKPFTITAQYEKKISEEHKECAKDAFDDTTPLLTPTDSDSRTLPRNNNEDSKIRKRLLNAKKTRH